MTNLEWNIVYLYVTSVFFTTLVNVEGVPTEQCQYGLYFDTALSRCDSCVQLCPWVGYEAIPQPCSAYCQTTTSAPTTTTTSPGMEVTPPLSTTAIIVIALGCMLCVVSVVGFMWLFVPACQPSRNPREKEDLDEEDVPLVGVQETNTEHHGPVWCV
ncbi:uncharacterized protein [Haliotis cracherodii]|uniref:uncharacterized protein n=1 Tax=Haliotis cracherodii TaxID=6455 RepID=UPI0039E849B5